MTPDRVVGWDEDISHDAYRFFSSIINFEGLEAYGLPDVRQAPKHGISGDLDPKRDIRNIHENRWLDKRDIWI